MLVLTQLFSQNDLINNITRHRISAKDDREPEYRPNERVLAFLHPLAVAHGREPEETAVGHHKKGDRADNTERGLDHIADDELNAFLTRLIAANARERIFQLAPRGCGAGGRCRSKSTGRI